MSEVQRRPPNLVLLITDQQRAPHALARGARLAGRADAERRRAAAHRHQLHPRLHAPRRCARPAARRFLTGQVPLAPRGDAHADRGRPLPRHATTCPTCSATVARLAGSGEVPRSRLVSRFVRGLAAARPEERQRARAAAPGIDTLATLLRERGYHVAIKGKWHLSKPVNGSELERRRLRSGSSATTASPTGSRRTRAATPRRRPSAAATPASPTRAGTRTTRARWSSGCGTRGPARAVLPRLLARQPARRARLPVLVRDGRLRARRSSATSACRCRRRWTRTCARSPRVHSLMKLGQTAYIGALARRAGAAGLRELLRLPAQAWWTRRSGGCSPRSASRRSRARCARAR